MRMWVSEREWERERENEGVEKYNVKHWLKRGDCFKGKNRGWPGGKGQENGN